ncbi:hypothetical protein BC939DRAFT_533488 [Gamsiella multidivaricata]|uniref:uncharacterized protein n=1 Tax=Gamsiella multidivaricata TaxID=101098 RepID=UPI00221F1ADB|nr:uncharacterized protein BC939DRAFT_533488 [Gamsiella multidivaricata]KAI7816508.1 hypothetical protein BC939DRAFT_533488 [Gamsiella multidivaricata]
MVPGSILVLRAVTVQLGNRVVILLQLIEKRCSQLAMQPRIMLDKILGRGSGKMVIGRIQREVDGRSVNILELGEIKKHVRGWFDEWYGYLGLQNRWSQDAPKLKAPGVSRITNNMLKHQGPLGSHILFQIVGAAIIQEEVPKDWSTGLLYCIPKAPEWPGNMAEVRPIALLEHARKTMFAILTNRLSAILSRHSILRGPNFSALKGTTTKDPFHILQAAMDDAM